MTVTALPDNTRPPVMRLPLYLGINILFVLLLGVGAAASGASEPRILYLVCLFALCSSPIIDIDSLNGRFAMMGAFLLVYFISFGIGDVAMALTGAVPEAGADKQGILTQTEAVILIGGLMLVLGYRQALRMAAQRTYIRPAKDWPESALVLMGLALFAAGTVSTWYLNVYVMPDKNISADIRLAQLDPRLTAVLLLGNLVLPLGIIILAYAYAAYRRTYMTPVILSVVAMQFLTGFVTDTKADAMLAGLIVIMTRVLIDGKLPKVWLAGGVAFVIVVFPFLQAYRAEVIGAQGLNHMQVAQNLGRAFKTAWAATGRNAPARSDERQKNFVERATLKGSVALAVENCGNTVEYQNGRTLIPLLTAFVPRLLVPDKINVESGRLFGKEFRASTYTDTYISPSHLGELYWNFGWLGVIAGMFGIGYLLGFMGARCDFTEFRSVSRLLVLASTGHLLIWRFEATITTNYVVWERAILMIALLHFVFAHIPAARGSKTNKPGPQVPEAADAKTAPFPQLLR